MTDATERAKELSVLMAVSIFSSRRERATVVEAMVSSTGVDSREERWGRKGVELTRRTAVVDIVCVRSGCGVKVRVWKRERSEV